VQFVQAFAISPSANPMTTITAIDPIAAATAKRVEVISNAKARLQEKHFTQLKKIECHFHEGALTLRGMVSSYFMKQIAQTAVSDVPGVEEIINHLHVIVDPV
jgi:osmotically-inducible protein OsmY